MLLSRMSRAVLLTLVTATPALAAPVVISDIQGYGFDEKRALVPFQSLVFDDGKLKAASFDESQGFGFRAVSGETAAFYALNVQILSLGRKGPRIDQYLRFFVDHHPDYTPEELPSGPMALLH